MKPSNSLNHLVNANLAIEKLRVSSEVRQSHLALQGNADPDTAELHEKLLELEKWSDKKIATLLKEHPAYSWFSKIRGVGLENVAKIIGLVRVEPPDYLICPECHNEVRFDNEGDKLKLVGTKCPACEIGLLKEVPYADTISALWSFAGYSVDENGKAPKRKAGEKLGYNSTLRSMAWRLAGSILKAGLRQKCLDCGEIVSSSNDNCPKCKSSRLKKVGISKFAQYYLNQKERYTIRFQNEGIKLLPQNKIPKKDGVSLEGHGYISEGHLHQMAQRKLIKLFLSLLFISWREGLQLPYRSPYAIEQLKHKDYMKPEDFVDKE